MSGGGVGVGGKYHQYHKVMRGGRSLTCTTTTLPTRGYSSNVAVGQQQQQKTVGNEKIEAVVKAMKELSKEEVLSFGAEVLRRTGYKTSVIEAIMIQFTKAPVPAAAPPPQEAPVVKPVDIPQQEAPKQESPKEEEFTKSASVKLISFPDGQKIFVLKEIRKLKPGMNLLDSKKLVENLPQILQKDVLPQDLMEWKTALEAVGAKLEFV